MSLRTFLALQIAAVLTLALAGSVGRADDSVITQTASIPLTSPESGKLPFAPALSQFDSSQGVLNSVMLTLSATLSASGEVTSHVGGEIMTVIADSSFTLSGLNSLWTLPALHVSTSYELGNTHSQAVPFGPFTDTDSATITFLGADLAQFLGTSALSFLGNSGTTTASVTPSHTPKKVTSTAFAQVGATISLVYNYTPVVAPQDDPPPTDPKIPGSPDSPGNPPIAAVPEPANSLIWILMGMLGVAATAWRRKAR